MASVYSILKTTAKTVSTNAELILRENPARRYLLVQNNDASVAVYVAFGDTYGPAVSATSGIVINAGEEKEFSVEKHNISKEKVYVTAASTNADVLVTEAADNLVGLAAFDPPAAGSSSSSSSSSSESSSSESSSSPSSESSNSSSSESSNSPSNESSSG